MRLHIEQSKLATTVKLHLILRPRIKDYHFRNAAVRRIMFAGAPVRFQGLVLSSSSYAAPLERDFPHY